jgi:hypothetical protein
MPRGFKVFKLSDEFGQYLLVITCIGCGHERRAYPKTLARMCGWDSKIQDLEKRLRCSKCGKKGCSIRALEMQKPRGTRPANTSHRTLHIRRPKADFHDMPYYRVTNR